MNLDLKYFVTILLIMLQVIAFSQIDVSVNIAVDRPKVKAVDNVNNIAKAIRSQLEECIADNSGFVSYVERDHLKAIKEIRKGLKKRDNPAVASSVMVGANYILESKVSEIVSKLSSKNVKKFKNGKNYVDWVMRYNVSYVLDLSLIEVETGEEVANQRIHPNGWAFESIKYKELVKEDELFNKALADTRSCLHTTLSYMLMIMSPAQVRIIDVNEIKKDKAKKILIKGGQHTPYRKGLKFDILKIYNQEIGGSTVLRKEKIGEAQLEEIYRDYTQCKIKKGHKEVLKAFNAGMELYCKPKDLKVIDSCEGILRSLYQRGKSKNYNSAITETTKPKEKKSNTTKTKKTRKKVTRKKGGK